MSITKKLEQDAERFLMGSGVTTGQIRTYTGKMVRPLQLNVLDVDLEDIAHALSNQCRFTGHTSSFYSVAQHSMLVAGYVWDRTQNNELALAGLFHDASEVYLMDLAAPIKDLPEFSRFREIENDIQHVIEDRFGFVRGAFEHPEIKRADMVLRWTEMRDLMGRSPDPGWETLDYNIHPLSPKLAQSSWESMLDWLCGFDRDRLIPGRLIVA